MVQKVAMVHGIQTLGLAPGTVLSDERARTMLYDGRKSVYIAAAHIRALADAAIAVLQAEGSTSRNNFNYRYFFGKTALDDRMKATAMVIGYNLDQWQMTGKPKTRFHSDRGYEQGIGIALEDIWDHLGPGKTLKKSITETPRNYVETVDTLGIPVPDAQRPYRWFRPGDIIPNFYASKSSVTKKEPED